MLLALPLLLVACGGGGTSDGGADAGAGAVARFSIGEAPLAFAAVPFPNDLYLDDAGHPNIGALPTRQSESPRMVALRELLAVRRGFCGSCNVYFGIDGALDAASVPASATPASTASIDDAIVMLDPIDDALIPLRVEYDPTNGWIAVRPVRGIVLRRDRQYVVALTTSLRASDGSPLAVDADLAAILDGGGDARARAILEPAIDALIARGLERERIASVTSFTVGDPTIDLRDVRAALQAAPAPVAVVDRVWSTAAELDDLLGVPSEDRPGIDVPPAAGTEGTRSIRHATVEAVVAGRFTSPRFVEGTTTEIGAPRRDTNGAIAPGPAEDVPFVLIVPTGADLTNLPIVVHHHGFNASRTTGFVLADTAGLAGAAVLSIDGYQHGERAAQHEDVLHNMRGGVAGADGFAETDTLAVSSRVFGIEGAPDGMTLFPGYALGAFLQFAADVMAAVRFVRDGDLTPIQDSLRALSRLAFDRDRVLYAGNSMGSVVGASVLTAESDIRAFVLNVQPGSMVDTLAEGAEFRPLAESVFLPVLGVTGEFDEVTRSVVFDPTIDLFRWALEPVDPLALSPYFFVDPVAAGERPDVLFQLASLDQLAAPPAVQSVLASAGVPGFGTFELANVAPVSVPISANLVTPSGTITAAAYRFDPAAHGMLENLTQSSDYELPLLPPLVPRPSIVVTNPIVEVHAQIENFARTRIQTGRAEIR